MATTAIIPLHGHIGKTIQQTLKDCTDYVKNPEKTGNEKYISTYQCSKESIVNEFMAVKNMYELTTGRSQKITDNVLAYMLRQSFQPEEITPELANKIGYQLAMDFTGGQHQFIVCTHIDKKHIHNHIVFNSTTLDYRHKFNNEKNTYQRLREISDKLCLEHQLSVIENPKEKGKSYQEWAAEKTGTSWKAKLKETIDIAIPQCTTFDEFLSAMRAAGYEVKQRKHIAFRAIGQERFTRLRTLGMEYSETVLQERIAKQNQNKQSQRSVSNKNINLIIDIQSRLAQGKGKGYEHWAKLFNLKQAAKTVNYLTENNITQYSLLEEKTKETFTRFNDISKQIKQKERHMNDIAKLKNHIINYVKTKDIYKEYKKSKQPERFRFQHESELIIHEATKKYFDTLHTKKLPSVSSLQSEYTNLLEEKKALYQEYKNLKDKLQEQQTIKQNVISILQISNEQADPDKKTEKNNKTL